jgi:hypothetical protein
MRVLSDAGSTSRTCGRRLKSRPISSAKPAFAGWRGTRRVGEGRLCGKRTRFQPPPGMLRASVGAYGEPGQSLDSLNTRIRRLRRLTQMLSTMRPDCLHPTPVPGPWIRVSSSAAPNLRSSATSADYGNNDSIDKSGASCYDSLYIAIAGWKNSGIGVLLAEPATWEVADANLFQARVAWERRRGTIQPPARVGGADLVSPCRVDGRFSCGRHGQPVGHQTTASQLRSTVPNIATLGVASEREWHARSQPWTDHLLQLRPPGTGSGPDS